MDGKSARRILAFILVELTCLCLCVRGNNADTAPSPKVSLHSRVAVNTGLEKIPQPAKPVRALTDPTDRRTLESPDCAEKGECMPHESQITDNNTGVAIQVNATVQPSDSISNLLQNFPLCLVTRPIVAIKHYDPHYQMCCNGLFNKESDHDICCGGEIVNGSQVLCCNDEKFNRSEKIGEECCGNVLYNKSLEICCGHRLHKRAANTTCCGDDSYDVTVECCGPLVFFTDEYLCCNLQVQPKNGINSSCCDRTSYDADVCDCVDDEVVPRETGYNCSLLSVTPVGNTTDNTFGGVFNDTTPDVETGDGHSKKIRNELLVALLVAVMIILISAMLVIKRIRTRKAHMQRMDTDYEPVNDCSAESGYLTSFDASLSGAFVETHGKHNVINEAERSAQTWVSTMLDENVNDNDDASPKVLMDNEASIHLNEDFYRKGSLSGDDVNMSINLFINTCTQTDVLSISNRRTIFGQAFDERVMVDGSCRTVSMKHSQVELTLPAVGNHPIEVHCSSFRNRPRVRRKLGISPSLDIASPVVEYSLTGHPRFDDYACVKMPFIGQLEHLQVWKFKSDEGLRTIAESFEVKQKGKINEHADVFYEVEGSHVKIYTRSFSGFFCTTCRHRPISLMALVYGSYKRINSNLEVRLKMYIVDEIYKIEDYKHNLAKREDLEGRVLKKMHPIPEPETSPQRPLSEQSYIEVKLCPMDWDSWRHMPHPETGAPLYPFARKVPVRSVVQMCSQCEHYHPSINVDSVHGHEWYLVNRAGMHPSYTFQCHYRIAVCAADEIVLADSTLTIDELQLRASDMLPVQAGSDVEQLDHCVRGIKEYIAGLPEHRSKPILDKLREKLGEECTSISIETIFHVARNNFSLDFLMKSIVDILHCLDFHEEIKALQKHGFVPPRFIVKFHPTQVVSSDNENTAMRQLPPALRSSTADDTSSEQRDRTPVQCCSGDPGQLYNPTQSDNRLCQIGIRLTGVPETDRQEIQDTRNEHIQSVRGELGSGLKTGPNQAQSAHRPHDTCVQEHASHENTHVKQLSVIPEEQESLLSNMLHTTTSLTDEENVLNARSTHSNV